MTIDLSKLNNLVAAAPKALARPSGKSWFNINNSGNVTAVYLHSDIGGYGVTSADFAREISGLGDFELHFNSQGGSVWEGLAIYANIQQHNGVVTGIVDSLAASAASIIACACDSLLMAKNARLMVHDAAVGYGEVQGNAETLRSFVKDIEQAADFLDEISDTAADIYVDKAGGTRKTWRATMKQETWYNAQAAVKAKLADGILGETNNGPTNSAEQKPKNDPPAIDVEGIRNALKGAFA